MIETRIHNIPLQGTVIFAGLSGGKNRISGDDSDPISPIELCEVPGYPHTELFNYRMDILSLDLDNETAECEVTGDTALHNWLEGRLAFNIFQDMKDSDDKYKLKRKDLE